jgi:hypothetical protein
VNPVHIYFVLDRSGSMAAIRDDVVGGFNSFVDRQRGERGHCLMTLVQFDSADPFEVLLDARHLSTVPALTPEAFQPRGGTPLYDAMGHAIANATIRAEQRATAGEGPEEIVFVTFSDGQENASHEYDRTKVFEAIKKREARGWSFGFLGANQDSYAEGHALGFSPGSVQNFKSDRAGIRSAFDSLTRSVTSQRARVRAGLPMNQAEFFDGVKEAEEDLARRGKP